MLIQRHCSRIKVLLVLIIGVACTMYSCYIMHSKLNNIREKEEQRKLNKSTINDAGMYLNIGHTLKIPLQQEVLKDIIGVCEIPKLDPFSKEMNQFYKALPPVVCEGKDWVKCYHSVCKIQRSIQNKITNFIMCIYRDIIFDGDEKYHFGPPTTVFGDGIYVLDKSDNVKIFCMGEDKRWKTYVWSGHAAGIRKSVQVNTPPEGREDTYNVMIVGFDSTSKNGFFRHMPKSYDVLVNDLKAVIMNGYNIVGEGTPAALFPLLTGHNEQEVPDARRGVKNNNNITMDMVPFIFYKLKEDGYRTAYLEDSPRMGTFQLRFNGFVKQPTDHYMRPFFNEVTRNKNSSYCIGDTPQYLVMLSLTKQLFQLKGKKFCFTFIVDICHDDINRISTADEDLSRFLDDVKESGILKNTALIVMSDHGPKFAEVRATLQGKLEERLPFLAIKVPEAIQGALVSNSHTLVTAYDLHTTILDITGLQKHQNDFKVPGADLPRGISLLERIPVTRSCFDAGIDPHWCSCLRWINVSRSERVYLRAGNELVAFINNLTEPHRPLCAPRTLTSLVWLMRQRPNEELLSFHRNSTGYVGKYEQEYYQIRITVGPGIGEYEATMAYNILGDSFTFNSREISRTNAYGDESECISMIDSKLNMFCYCKN